MSIRRFAKPLGVNHETLRRYMHNGRVPASVLARIAALYEVDCNWLLTGLVKETAVSPAGRLAKETQSMSVVVTSEDEIQPLLRTRESSSHAANPDIQSEQRSMGSLSVSRDFKQMMISNEVKPRCESKNGSFA